MIKRHFRKILVFLLIILCFTLYDLPIIKANGFTETFDNNVFDSQLWQPHLFGSGVGIGTRNQQLEISFSENAAGGFIAGEAMSTCKLRGNFDIQTDYYLATWPMGSGVRVGLAASNTPNDLANIGVVEHVGFGVPEGGAGDGYVMHSLGGGPSNYVSTTNRYGKLRLVRTGSTIYAYYYQNGAWAFLTSAPASTEDVSFALAAWSHGQYFIRQPVVVAFDNVQVNSGEEVCPFPTNTPTPTITPTPAVAMFKQNDPRWKNEQYAFETGSCSTIEKCGCALTTLAMTLNHHGATKDPQTGGATTPETVNDYFKLSPAPFKCKDASGSLYNGFVSKGYLCGQVNWGTADLYSADAFKKFGTQKILWLTKNSDVKWDISTVQQDLANNNPVILKVLSDPHWALATGIYGNTFSINDPSYNNTKLNQSPYTNSALAIRRYIKTSSDFSRIELATFAPNNLLITDPDGKKTGFDPSSSSVIEQIPDSSYFFDKIIDDDTNDGPIPPDTAGVNWLVISTPKQGMYNVQITSPQGEESNYIIYASDRSAGLTFHPIESSSSGQNGYSFNYSPEPGDQTLVLEVPIDIMPESDTNPINCKDKNGVIPVAVLSTNTFNALDVDADSVVFEGAKEAHIDKKTGKAQRHEEDVNADGKLDLVFHFRQIETNLSCIASSAKLSGKTKNGLTLEGQDLIKATN